MIMRWQPWEPVTKSVVSALIVAIGSVPTGDMGLDGSDMWLWVNDVIVPALG
jgi:hypothetical protein